MSKISLYPSGTVALSTRLIGTDDANADETKNFSIASIIALVSSGITDNFVPYIGAEANVDLDSYSLTANSGTFQSLIVDSGTFGSTLGVDGELSANGSPGNLGEILVSGGVGTHPTWQPSSSIIQPPYLSAHSTTSQVAIIANTAYAMTFNAVDLSNNISINSDAFLNPTRIAPAESGIYNVQFSAQIQRTTGGSSATVDIWFRVGGVDVPSSNTSINVQANRGFLVASWNLFVSIDVELADPYIEIMWATTDTNVTLHQAAANAVHPETPSVILTVNKVSSA